MFRARPKRVAEDAADRLLDVVLAINRNRPADPARKQPGVVEPKEMVGMRVSKGNRMDKRTRSRKSCIRISGVVSISRLPAGNDKSTLGRVR